MIIVAGKGHGVYSGVCVTWTGDWTQRRAVENTLKMGHDGVVGAIGQRKAKVNKCLWYARPCKGYAQEKRRNSPGAPWKILKHRGRKEGETSV